MPAPIKINIASTVKLYNASALKICNASACENLTCHD
jgi:hypothetical protein